MAMEPNNSSKGARKKAVSKADGATTAAKTSVRKSAAKAASKPAAVPGSTAPLMPVAETAPKASTKGKKMSLNDMTTEAKTKANEWKGEAGKYADQASVRAKELANEGKTKTAGAMGSLAKMIEDAAPQVDEKLGTQYGDFARSAAKTVSGMANSLEQQDVDALVNNTREFVKKSPAVAIGTAAVVGFVLARMFKSTNKD